MLSDALRLLRKFHDKSQTEMAAALGVSKSLISQIEAGNRRPTLELLEKYAAVFEVPTSSVLFFAEHLDDSLSEQRNETALVCHVPRPGWLARGSEPSVVRHGRSCRRRSEVFDSADGHGPNFWPRCLGNNSSGTGGDIGGCHVVG